MTRKTDPTEPRIPASEMEAQGGHLPAFTPVPRLKDRNNGWKPHIQLAFIEALAETGSVAAACRRVGRADHGAYLLRRHADAGSFRAAWDAALDFGVRRIEDAAMDRALYGTEETIHYHGDHIATRRRYNERLVMFILRNRAADRFAEHGAKGPDAVGTMQLKRLKKQWREEWEAEKEANTPSVAEIRAGIDEKVQALRRAVQANLRYEWTRLSQEARTAYGTYHTARARDLNCEVDIPDHLKAQDGDAQRENWWDADKSWNEKPRSPEEEEEETDPLALPAPDGERDEEASKPKGPRIIGLKDDGWD